MAEHSPTPLDVLLGLQEVYWNAQGRKGVDSAIGVIAAGATTFPGLPFWPHARRALSARHPQ
jgi:hypothetical protein